MNRHTKIMTKALRGLDPACESVLTEAERQRAADGFGRIIATSGDAPTPVEPDRPRRRRGWRLLVPVGLVGATGATGATGAAVAALLLGGSAFASWTPTPEPLTSMETSAAAATCRADYKMPASGEATLLAERRGDWTYVLISGPKAEAICLMRNDRLGRNTTGHEGFRSYDTDPPKAPTVARDHIVEWGSQMGSTDEGWFRGEGWLTLTNGYVGSDVTGVTVHTPLGFDVEASVDNWRFAAWWPSDQPSSKNLDVMGAWSYTVTLADGSTRHTTG